MTSIFKLSILLIFFSNFSFAESDKKAIIIIDMQVGMIEREPNWNSPENKKSKDAVLV